MPLPVNFYQNFPGDTGNATGAVPVVPFFTGFYLPASLVGGQTVGFLYPLSEPTSLGNTLNASGLTEKDNKDTFGSYVSFYGDTTVLIKESGNYSVILSGQSIKDNIDAPNYRTSFTSSIISDKIDNGQFYIKLNSGLVNQDNSDSNNYSVNFSGLSTLVNNDTNGYFLSFYGGFTGPNVDAASVTFGINSITYQDSQAVFVINTADTGSVTFKIGQIIYDDSF